MFEDYLKRFLELIDGLLDHAIAAGHIEGGKDVDLIVLTGGHSQWYWVEEMLAGVLPRFKGPALEQIREEPVRILQGPHPQEAVARGMAMSGSSSAQNS